MFVTGLNLVNALKKRNIMKEIQKMKCLAECIFNFNNECTLKQIYITKLGSCSELIFKTEMIKEKGDT